MTDHAPHAFHSKDTVQPFHLERAGKATKSLATRQKKSTDMRKVKVTLPRAPWDKRPDT